MRHSKGPWVITPRFQDKIDIHHAEPKKVGAASLVVARVTCRDSWLDEQMANARLIAAAPELLYALEMMLDQFRYTSINNGDDAAIVFAKHAIAKAKGESV